MQMLLFVLMMSCLCSYKLRVCVRGQYFIVCRIASTFSCVPMRVTVPGGVALRTSSFDRENAFLRPTMVVFDEDG